jgi:glycosyltransferase involved in cell wall biosynthesis
MRLIVNAVGLRVAGGHAVGINVLRHLRVVRPDLNILAIVPAAAGYEEVCESQCIPYQAFEQRRLSTLRRVWLDQIEVNRAAKRWKAEAILSLNNHGPWRTALPHVVLLHNPFYVYPVTHWWPAVGMAERAHILIRRAIFRRVVDAASIIAVQTDVMRDRLSETYGVRHEAIRVVPNTLIPEYASQHIEPRRLHGVGDDQIAVLTLSRYYSHKNLEFILRVARMLRSVGNRRFVFFLTIEAHQHPRAAALLNAITAEGLENTIVNLGNISHGDLPALYAATDVAFIPSLLESHSASYIEAASHGIAIVASDLDFARASCGDRAHYFNPASVEDAIRTLERASTEGRRPASTVAKARSWHDVCADLAFAVDAAVAGSGGSALYQQDQRAVATNF